MKTAFILYAAIALAGCNSSPVAAVRAGAASIRQHGTAAKPGTAETLTTRSTLPLPPGTKIETSNAQPQAIGITLPAPSVLTVETVTERATGPQSLTPPAPPSPSEVSAGRAKLWLTLALAVGAGALLFGLVKGWDFVAIGGGCLAAGSMVGLVLNAVPAWLWAVLAAGVAIGGTGWAVWKFKIEGKNE